MAKVSKKKTKVSDSTKSWLAEYLVTNWDPSNDIGLSKSYSERRVDAKKRSDECNSPKDTIYMNINFMANIAQDELTDGCQETTMVGHGHEGPKWCRELVEGLIIDGLIK